MRLYQQRDYEARPEFTDEEIIRLDLSEVVLRLIDLGVRGVESFPFPTKPPRSKIRAALELLRALGAIDDARHLTAIGKRMVPFPLAPRLARVIVEAADHFPDVTDDVLVVGAFMSGRPPWLFPPGEEAEARHGQLALAQPLGDAATAVHAYRGWARTSKQDAWCRRHYVDPHVMAFIHKAHLQLIDIAEHHGIQIRSGGPVSHVVRSVAAGFIDRVLRLEGRNYIGPGDMRVAIHPSSVLFGERRRFVVAAELVVSRRPYARAVSALEPAWIAELSPELAQRWNLRGPRRRRQELDPSSVPAVLRLGGAELPVTVRRGEALVEVPSTEVPALLAAGADVADDLPAGAARWKARISTEHYRFAPGTPLLVLLDLLPHLPLPAHDQRLARDVPEGALLEADRNLHTLERHLDRLLQPALPLKGRRSGWLMLAANGGGGYWYEVCERFPDAVEATRLSLEDLVATLDPDDPLQARLVPLLEEVTQRAETVGALLAAHRLEQRRQRRQRRRS